MMAYAYKWGKLVINYSQVNDDVTHTKLTMNHHHGIVDHHVRILSKIYAQIDEIHVYCNKHV